MKIIITILFFFICSISVGQNPFYSKSIVTTPLTAPNIPPVANAGIDQAIQLPTNSVTVNGSGSTDTDGTITGYAWVILSGSGTVTSPALVSTTITGLTQGTTVVKLTVTDNSGDTDTDTLNVFTNAAVNIPPVANAGADSTITLPVSQCGLIGTATDADGAIVSTVWTQIGATPSVSIITNSTTLTPTVSGLIEGTYNFTLTVTDNQGGTATDIVRVIVLAATPPSNIPPVANAGPNVTVQL